MNGVSFWKLIIIPLIMILHVLPFYLLVVRHEVISQESVMCEKNETVNIETGIEFEEDIKEEVVEQYKDVNEDAYAYKENEINDRTFNKDSFNQEIMSESNKNDDETDELLRQKREEEEISRNLLALLEKQKNERQEKRIKVHKNVENVSSDSSSKVSNANEPEKHLSQDNYKSVTVDYQKYYESYRYYSPPDGEDGYKPSLALIVMQSPEIHNKILKEMGFQLMLRPRKTPYRGLDPDIDNFHIVVTDNNEMVKRDGLPVGFALDALGKDRNYYLREIKAYPWFTDISSIPLEVVFVPKLPKCRNYVLGRMYKAMQDLGLMQKDVIEITGEIRKTREGQLVLIITELIVRNKEGGKRFKKIPYNDHDISRFIFIS